MRHTGRTTSLTHPAVHLYNDWLLPKLCHLAMRSGRLAPYRQRVLSGAEGEVLEIGLGSGLNLPFYGPSAKAVYGLEPAGGLLAVARRGATAGGRLPVTLIRGSAETIPMDNHSVDTVVTTWTLCSIPAVIEALTEMRRVLKPQGRLMFVEHGLAPDSSVRRWQHRLTPVWRRFSGGCHLDRAIPDLIAQAGFRIEHLDTGYMRGPRAVTFMYEGASRPC